MSGFELTLAAVGLFTMLVVALIAWRWSDRRRWGG